MNSINQKQKFAIGLALLGVGIVAGVALTGCGSKSTPNKKSNDKANVENSPSSKVDKFEFNVIREDSKNQGMPSNDRSDFWKGKAGGSNNEIIFKDILDLDRETFLVWSDSLGDNEITNAVYSYLEDGRVVSRKNALKDSDSNRFFLPIIASTEKRPEDIDSSTMSSFQIELYMKNGSVVQKTIEMRLRGPVGKVDHQVISFNQQFDSSSELVHKLTHDGVMVLQEEFKNETGQFLSAEIQPNASTLNVISGVRHSYSVQNGHSVDARAEFFKSETQVKVTKTAHVKYFDQKGVLVSEADLDGEKDQIKAQLLPFGITQVQWIVKTTKGVASC